MRQYITPSRPFAYHSIRQIQSAIQTYSEMAANAHSLGDYRAESRVIHAVCQCEAEIHARAIHPPATRLRVS